MHNGHLERATVAEALRSGDPVPWLIRSGAVNQGQWDEWAATDGGERPQLRRYEILGELGQGGMARVFRAVDRTDGAEVALKVLRPEPAGDPKHRDAFVQEARLLIDLEDDHIVKGFRVAKEGATVYFAMEPLAGRCLQDGLDEEHPLEEGEALAVVEQVAHGLAACRPGVWCTGM